MSKVALPGREARAIISTRKLVHRFSLRRDERGSPQNNLRPSRNNGAGKNAAATTRSLSGEPSFALLESC